MTASEPCEPDPFHMQPLPCSVLKPEHFQRYTPSYLVEQAPTMSRASFTSRLTPVLVRVAHN